MWRVVLEYMGSLALVGYLIFSKDLELIEILAIVQLTIFYLSPYLHGN